MRHKFFGHRGRLRNSLVLALLLLAAGCNSRGTVSGKVFYKDAPVPGGSLTFLTQQGSITCPIEEDGSYRAQDLPLGSAQIIVETVSARYSGQQSGLMTFMMKHVPPGEIEQRKKEMEEGNLSRTNRDEKMGSASGKSGKRYVPIPAHYNDPTHSGLTYNVQGGSQTHDIKLE
jgi:hypothetical protein